MPIDGLLAAERPLDMLKCLDATIEECAGGVQNALHDELAEATATRRPAVWRTLRVSVKPAAIPDQDSWNVLVRGDLLPEPADGDATAKFSSFVEKVCIHGVPDEPKLEWVPKDDCPQDGFHLVRPHDEARPVEKIQLELHFKSELLRYHTGALESIVGKKIAPLHTIYECLLEYANVNKLREQGSVLVRTDALLQKTFAEETTRVHEWQILLEHLLQPAEEVVTVTVNLPSAGATPGGTKLDTSPASDASGSFVEEHLFNISLAVLPTAMKSQRQNLEDANDAETGGPGTLSMADVDARLEAKEQEVESCQRTMDFFSRLAVEAQTFLPQILHSASHDIKLLQNHRKRGHSTTGNTVVPKLLSSDVSWNERVRVYLQHNAAVKRQK